MASKDAGAHLQSLDALLHPIGRAYFLKEVYCQKPLFIPGDADRFLHLLDWEGLNRAASRIRKNRSPLRLAKDGRIFPQQEFAQRVVDSFGEFWNVDFEAVRQHLSEGATLIIDRIDETHEPLSDYCRMLEAEFGARAFIDSFASWKQTQGFPTHWDPEQVFISQVIGTKHWRVLKPERLHPTNKDKALHEKPPTEAYWEGDMKPGDLLYIPGGWWHDALAVSDQTLHISVGLFPPTGMELAGKVLDQIYDDEVVRAPLPRFASESDQRAFVSNLRRVMNEKLDAISVSDFLEEADASTAPRTRLSTPWSAVSEGERLPDDAWVHWLSPRAMGLKDHGAEVSLRALGTRFTFAAVAAPVLRDLIKTRKFPIEDLCARHPTLGVRPFLIQLVSSGLVAITSDAAI